MHAITEVKRETLNIRIKPEVRDLIDRAAKSRGNNRTDFIVATGNVRDFKGTGVTLLNPWGGEP